MYHSINFDEFYNTYETWHLIPSKRPVMDPADLEYIYSTIPPFNPYYHKYMSRGVNIKRTGSWDFIVDHNYAGYNQPELYSEIQSILHGTVRKITFEDDPDYYYIGKVTVGQWNPEDHYSTITISVECDPFKYGEPVVKIINTTGSVINNPCQFTLPVIAKLVLGNDSPNNYVTINGLARDKFTGESEAIAITTTTLHPTIIVDGEKKFVYNESNPDTIFTGVDMWAFPSLKPGSNIIAVGGFRNTNETVDRLEVTYTPRYL